MYISDLTEATRPHEQKAIDPALLTFKEYTNLINDEGKMHSSGAYKWSLEKDTFKKNQPSEYPKLLQSVKLKGIQFDFRLKTEDRIDGQFPKRNPETDEYLRDENKNLIFFTKEELLGGAIPSLLTRRYDYSVGIFTKEDGYVGGSQDEWGCMLLSVAQEYRGFGLGPILSKFARQFDPTKTSGGFTPEGYANFRKTHTAMVREYLQSGMYSFLVRSGQISKEKVKDILASANLSDKPKNTKNNLGTTDPKDWLMFVGGDGDYIIYDKKLADLYKDDKYGHFLERMIRGAIYASMNGEYSRIRQFGGESAKIKTYLMTLVANDAQKDDLILVVEPEDLEFVDRELIGVQNEQPDNNAGIKSHRCKYKKTPVDLTSLGAKERAFRKSFDKHDEFLNYVRELAYGKYLD